MAVREEDILQGCKAKANTDKWPQFGVQKVTITSQQDGKETSLLSAHQRNPLKLRGKLNAIDDDLMHLVRDKRYREKTIEVNNVDRYAFAECKDGSCLFWAAGKAGWFEIESAALPYKTVFAQMNEATSMFYMLADRLRRAHKRTPKLTTKALRKYAAQVFQDYHEKKGLAPPLNGANDVYEAYRMHRQFLITSMVEGQDGLDWKDTPMWNYFQMQFPEDFASIEARTLGQSTFNRTSMQDNNIRSKKRKSQSPRTEGSQPKRGKRRRRTSESTQPTTPINQSILDISSNNEDVGDPLIPVRKRKSQLRPSGGKSAKKAAARKGRLRQAQNSDNFHEDTVEVDQNLAQESPVITLRNAKDLEDLTNPPGIRASPDASPGSKFLPRKYLELKVVEYDLPLIESQGPGDLWTCTFDGCFFRVHEASTLKGKKKIKGHFKTHASSAQEKIDLALDESRPYLPVDNLVRRLQAFAPSEGTARSPDSLERKFSAPLRRRY